MHCKLTMHAAKTNVTHVLFILVKNQYSSKSSSPFCANRVCPKLHQWNDHQDGTHRCSRSHVLPSATIDTSDHVVCPCLWSWSHAEFRSIDPIMYVSTWRRRLLRLGKHRSFFYSTDTQNNCLQLWIPCDPWPNNKYKNVWQDRVNRIRVVVQR